jgi:hypothetical protein
MGLVWELAAPLKPHISIRIVKAIRLNQEWYDSLFKKQKFLSQGRHTQDLSSAFFRSGKCLFADTSLTSVILKVADANE